MPHGITEQYWTEKLNEDERLAWKMVSRCAAIVLALSVHKTGLYALDSILTTFAALLPQLIIESQRTYSRYTPRVRKRVIRIIVMVVPTSIAMIGIIVFSQVAVAAIGGVFIKSVKPNLGSMLERQDHPISIWLFLIVSMMAAFMAIFKVLRNLEYASLIYETPKSFLKDFFIYKRPRFDDSVRFREFEFFVIAAAFFYVNVAAITLSSILKVIDAI